MKRLWVFFAALAVCTIFAGLDDGDTHDRAEQVLRYALGIIVAYGVIAIAVVELMAQISPICSIIVAKAIGTMAMIEDAISAPFE